MAYDSARGRTVLFGGNGIAMLSDTWEWDGSNWSSRNTPVAPSVRVVHAMAYDSARGRVVLFGGNSPSGPLSDTWEWDGTTWSQRTPAVSPPARLEHAMAFDSARGRVVLFGGSGQSLPADTWEWDGTAWSLRIPALSPSARSSHAMAYDSIWGNVVMFGGENGSKLSDTWVWDGINWSKRAGGTTPPPRDGHAMVYDSARGRAVMFGGRTTSVVFLGDTWEHAPPVPATFASYGTGCAGTAGTPLLAPVSGSLPWVASTFSITLTNIPTGTFALPFMMVGASKTAWSTYSLPLDLGFIGMPGCTLLTSPDVTLTLTNLGGSARVDLLIPNDFGLLGRSFFTQGIVLDRPANAFGATTSNAGEATLGNR